MNTSPKIELELRERRQFFLEHLGTPWIHDYFVRFEASSAIRRFLVSQGIFELLAVAVR